METGEFYNQIIKEVVLEDVLFLAEHGEKDLSEIYVHMDRGDTTLLFCCLDKDGKDFVFMPQHVAEQKGWDMDTLYAYGVLNMRKHFPCKCISLEEYTRHHSEEMQLSAPAMEHIYMLVCENEGFPYASTGLYYSAKEIRELSENIHSELYVFQCDTGATFLCPVEEFTREEAAEILEAFAKESQDLLKGQVLVYSNGKLISLKEYGMQENRRQGRAV